MITYEVNDETKCLLGPEFSNTPIGRGVECCCICKSQLKVNSHPLVDEQKMIKETGFFVCILFYLMENSNHCVISHKHGGCEMFEKRSE